MASSRGNPDISDIIRSVVVIGLIILGLFAFGKLFTSTPDQTVSTVDYQQVLKQAQAGTDLSLLAPATLPSGWRATSARFEPGADMSGGSWHLGVLTADEEYVGVEQTPVSTKQAVDRWGAGSKASGSAEVAGQVWSVRTGPGDRLVYVKREGDRTTLVNGTIGQAGIERYISSLSTSG